VSLKKTPGRGRKETPGRSFGAFVSLDPRPRPIREKAWEVVYFYRELYKINGNKKECRKKCET